MTVWSETDRLTALGVVLLADPYIAKPAGSVSITSPARRQADIVDRYLNSSPAPTELPGNGPANPPTLLPRDRVVVAKTSGSGSPPHRASTVPEAVTAWNPAITGNPGTSPVSLHPSAGRRSYTDGAHRHVPPNSNPVRERSPPHQGEPDRLARVPQRWDWPQAAGVRTEPAGQRLAYLTPELGLLGSVIHHCLHRPRPARPTRTVDRYTECSSPCSNGPSGNDLLISVYCAATRAMLNNIAIPATATTTTTGHAFLINLALLTGPVCLCG